MENIQKINENTISVDRIIPSKKETVQYDYGFLKQQLIDIQKQKDDFDALRDAELLEVQTLLDEASKLGIVEKNIEPTPVEPISEPIRQVI